MKLSKLSAPHPKPCLYEGTIISIDHISQTGVVELKYNRGNVDVTFRYYGQHWVWNVDVYNDKTPYEYSSHAFCIGDIVLLIYGRKDENDIPIFIAVSTLSDNRSVTNKRWCWPLYPRDKVVIALFTYINDSNKSYGFPFITNSTRALLNEFTDQEGDNRALGTLDGPENYMVIKKESNGNFTPHAAHEFMTQDDSFRFIPDISGRTTVNFDGRLVGISINAELLMDNIPFATIGNFTSVGQYHSGYSTSRLFISIDKDNVLTVYKLVVDLNAANNDPENQTNEGISAVHYPFEVAVGRVTCPLCIQGIMELDEIPQVDLISDSDISISRWSIDPTPWGDYEPDTGWYDNLSSPLAALGKDSTESFSYVWAHQLSNLTAIVDIFVHHKYTFTTDSYGTITRELTNTIHNYGVHPTFSRVAGTRTLVPASPASSDPRTETTIVSGSVARGVAKCEISADGDYLFEADYEESTSHSKYISGDYDSGVPLLYKSAESGSIDSSYNIHYVWNGVDICSHDISLVSAHSFTFALVYDYDQHYGWLVPTGTESSSFTVKLIVFLHIDIKNGIFVFIECNINRGVSVSSMITNSSGYVYPSPASIGYDLYISNRGVKTLLKSWDMFSPSGYKLNFTDLQNANYEAFNWFRYELLGVSTWETPSVPSSRRYGATELLMPTHPVFIEADGDVYRLQGSATDIENFSGMTGEGTKVYENNPCPNIDVSYITEFWHDMQYDSDFSLHPFANKTTKWPKPMCIAAPDYPYYDQLRNLRSPFHNFVMRADGYVTRLGSSSTNAYKFSYTFDIGGYTDTVIVEHADMGKIETCTGRDDAIVTLN